jgi:hypothetical protein
MDQKRTVSETGVFVVSVFVASFTIPLVPAAQPQLMAGRHFLEESAANISR